MNLNWKHPGFGKCVYCGSAKNLSDEHIIPEAIGGRLIIENGSCEDCCRETHAFEGHVCDALRAIRRQLNFPSKTKGKAARERRAAEKLIIEADGNRIRVPIDEYPLLMPHLSFPMPTILFGLAPEDVPLNGGIHSIKVFPFFDQLYHNARRKYRANSIGMVGVDKSVRMDSDDFGRMLAKIAHCYALTEFNLYTFQQLLCPAILGKRPYCFPHYIGSQIQTTEAAKDLHEVSLDKSGIGHGQFIVVRVRLFAPFDAPAHLIVVGAPVNKQIGLCS